MSLKNGGKTFSQDCFVQCQAKHGAAFWFVGNNSNTNLAENHYHGCKATQNDQVGDEIVSSDIQSSRVKSFSITDTNVSGVYEVFT